MSHLVRADARHSSHHISLSELVQINYGVQPFASTYIVFETWILSRISILMTEMLVYLNHLTWPAA